MHFLHHVLSGIPAVFLFQCFIPPLKNCSNQSHLLKHISDIIILYSKSVTDFILYIWSKSWLFPPPPLQSPIDLNTIFFLTSFKALLCNHFFLMPRTSYLFNSETLLTLQFLCMPGMFFSWFSRGWCFQGIHVFV